MTLGIKDTQHCVLRLMYCYAECHYAKCLYAECCGALNVNLSEYDGVKGCDIFWQWSTLADRKDTYCIDIQE